MGWDYRVLYWMRYTEDRQDFSKVIDSDADWDAHLRVDSDADFDLGDYADFVDVDFHLEAFWCYLGHSL